MIGRWAAQAPVVGLDGSGNPVPCLNRPRRLVGLAAVPRPELAMTVARSVDDVERLIHDPTVGAGAFTALAAPAVAGTQRVSALPFDPTRIRPHSHPGASRRAGAPAATGRASVDVAVPDDAVVDDCGAPARTKDEQRGE